MRKKANKKKKGGDNVGLDAKCKIVKAVATLSNKKGYTKELNIIKWNDGDAQLDIRKWDRNSDKMQKGISLNSEEVAKLKEALATLEF